MTTYDDPQDPFMGFQPQLFRDWVDFYERVVIPIVEGSETDFKSPEVQEAMRLLRLCNPYWIAICFYMAAKAEPREWMEP